MYPRARKGSFRGEVDIYFFLTVWSQEGTEQGRQRKELGVCGVCFLMSVFACVDIRERHGATSPLLWDSLSLYWRLVRWPVSLLSLPPQCHGFRHVWQVCLFTHVLVCELRSSCLYKKYSYQTVSQVIFQIVVMHLHVCACRGMHVDTRGQPVGLFSPFTTWGKL